MDEGQTGFEGRASTVRVLTTADLVSTLIGPLVVFGKSSGTATLGENGLLT